MDIDADLAHLVARALADAELCRAAAARAEALDDIRWRSFASMRFREQAAHRARRLRVLAAECEVLAYRLRLLGILACRSEEAG
jgi:hypothetical protein